MIKKIQIALVALVLSWPAIGHEFYHDWKIPGSRSEKYPNGVSCCSDKDCQPIVSRVAKDGYEINIENGWWPVPANKVLKDEKHTDGQSHVCIHPPVADLGGDSRNPTQRIICFMPGVLM